MVNTLGRFVPLFIPLIRVRDRYAGCWRKPSR